MSLYAFSFISPTVQDTTWHTTHTHTQPAHTHFTVTAESFCFKVFCGKQSWKWERDKHEDGARGGRGSGSTAGGGGENFAVCQMKLMTSWTSWQLARCLRHHQRHDEPSLKTKKNVLQFARCSSRCCCCCPLGVQRCVWATNRWKSSVIERGRTEGGRNVVGGCLARGRCVAQFESCLRCLALWRDRCLLY